MHRTMRLLPRSGRARAAILVVVVLLVAGAAATRWNAGRSDPVSPGEALDAFRSAPDGARLNGAPRPGVYAYRASGRESGGAGPFTIGRDLPATAQMVVVAREGGWEAELLYSRQHIEGTRYVIAADGAIRVTWHRTKVTFAGIGRDDRRDVEPPSLAVPSNPVPGVAWNERYRTGDVTVRVENRIDRAEVVRVGGRPVDTVVIVTRATTDGPHPGTRSETAWWAPALGLPVRWDIDMDIGGTFGFEVTSSVRLQSTRPRV